MRYSTTVVNLAASLDVSIGRENPRYLVPLCVWWLRDDGWQPQTAGSSLGHGADDGCSPTLGCLLGCQLRVVMRVWGASWAAGLNVFATEPSRMEKYTIELYLIGEHAQSCSCGVWISIHACSAQAAC